MEIPVKIIPTSFFRWMPLWNVNDTKIFYYDRVDFVKSVIFVPIGIL